MLKVGYTAGGVGGRGVEQYPVLRPGRRSRTGSSSAGARRARTVIIRGPRRASGSGTQKFPAFAEWARQEDGMVPMFRERRGGGGSGCQKRVGEQREPHRWFLHAAGAGTGRWKTARYFAMQSAANSTPKFLWSAKMRFRRRLQPMGWRSGSGLRRILVLTFNPAVESAWQEDLLSYVDSRGRQFYSREYGEARNAVPQDLDQSKPIVCFSVRSSISLVRIGVPTASKLGTSGVYDELGHGCFR